MMGDRSRKDRAASLAGSFIAGALALLAAVLGYWIVFVVLLLAALCSIVWGWWDELPTILAGNWTSAGLTWETDGFTHSGDREGLLIKIRSGTSLQPLDFRVRFADADGIESYWVTLGSTHEIKTVEYWSPQEPGGARITLNGNLLKFRASEPALQPGLELVFNMISKQPLEVIAVQRHPR